jgi:hypothetical protein
MKNKFDRGVLLVGGKVVIKMAADVSITCPNILSAAAAGPFENIEYSQYWSKNHIF